MRAEFVRVQCEVARTGAGSGSADPHARRLWERRQHLLDTAIGELFAGAEFLLGHTPGFRRGFVADVTLAVRDFLPLAAELAALPPPPRVAVRGVGADAPGFFACPHLGCVTETRVCDRWPALGDDGSAVAAGLRRAAAFTRLDTLDMTGCELSEADFAHLAGAPLAALHTLDLSGCGVTDAGLAALLDGPLVGRLGRLRLDNNPLTDRAAYELIDRLAHAAAPPELRLGRPRLVGDAARGALRAAFGDRCHLD